MILKVCGVTNEGDALLAIEAGALYIGFIIGAKSPRLVDPEIVREISSVFPRHVKAVGVVDARKALDLDLVLKSEVRVVQLHWATWERYEEVKEILANYGIGVALATNSNEGWPLSKLIDVEYFLVDVKDHERKVQLVNWFRALSPPILGVAGGLRVENLEVLSGLKVDMVDVSSGIELRPGKKDPRLLRAFAEGVLGRPL